MNLRFRLLLIFGLLICFHISNAQNSIRSKALAIADASTTKINQAKQLYTWITSNIRYDVKSYLNGTPSNQSALETLKKKKGICYDFALLFKEMCSGINIECYMVYGYSKGYRLFSSNDFYRTDHCWNVLHIDTTWILVDATWGCGYLERKPTLWDKTKNVILKTPCINKKLVFIRKPNDTYFNPDPSLFIRTHIPLDPKYQILKAKVSMEGWVNESLVHDYSYSTISRSERLNQEKDFADSHQRFVEGIVGKEFNQKNNFDVSNGYLARAAEFLISKSAYKDSIDYSNTLALYNQSKEFMNIHIRVIDSVFQTRIKSLSREINQSNSLRNGMKLKEKKEFLRFSKKQISVSRSLKKIKSDISRLDQWVNFLSRFLVNPEMPFLKVDSTTIKNNNVSLEKSIVRFGNLAGKIDSVIKTLTLRLQQDSQLAMRAKSSKSDFVQQLKNLKDTVMTEENVPVMNHWEHLYFIYLTSREKYRIKANNNAFIRSDYSSIRNSLNALLNEYKTQSGLINQFYQYNGDLPGAALMFRNTNNSLLLILKNIRKVTLLYVNFYEHLGDFNNQDHMLNDEIAGCYKENLKLFKSLEEMLLQNQKNEFQVEKRMSNTTRNQCDKAIHDISTIMKNNKSNHYKTTL